jgi:hypothetical protein
MKRVLAGGLWLVLVISSALCVPHVSADSQGDRRIRTGARLFRALVAADMNLDKKLDTKQHISICIMGGDALVQREVADIVTASGNQKGIRGIPVDTCVMKEFAPPDSKVAAVFLAGEPNANDLQRLIDYTTQAQVILFSPFEGHVEKGVQAGISIEAKVQPYLNQRALKASGIELKPFFIKVARVRS